MKSTSPSVRRPSGEMSSKQTVELPLEIWVSIILHVRGERSRSRAGWALAHTCKLLYSARGLLARSITMDAVSKVRNKIVTICLQKAITAYYDMQYTHYICFNHVSRGYKYTLLHTGGLFHAVIRNDLYDRNSTTVMYFRSITFTCPVVVNAVGVVRHDFPTVLPLSRKEVKIPRRVVPNDINYHPFTSPTAPIPFPRGTIIEITGKMLDPVEQLGISLRYVSCEFQYPGVIITPTHEILYDVAETEIVPTFSVQTVA